MREHGGVSSKQTAGTNGISPSTIHTSLRNTESYLVESNQNCLVSTACKNTGRRKSKRHSQHKRIFEESQCLGKPVCNLSRPGLPDASSSENITSSTEIDLLLHQGKNTQRPGNKLENLVERSGKIDQVKAKHEYERCKRAVVYLKDYFKVKQEPENGIFIDYSVIEKLRKMKPGGSRSPKRHSPVRVNVTPHDAKQINVNTNSKEGPLEGKNPLGGKTNSFSLLDNLSDVDSVCTESPKTKKKSQGKDETVTKLESPRYDHSKSQKKRSLSAHGDNAILETDQGKTGTTNAGKGHGDSVVVKDCSDNNLGKDNLAVENTGTVKKRGKKQKSANSTPEKQKKSKGSNNEVAPSSVTSVNVNSQQNEGKKIPKSPRTKKKKEESQNLLEITKPVDETAGKGTSSGKANSRGMSESPSPVRKKRSPKKEQTENKSPESKKLGSPQKSKKGKVVNENDDSCAVGPEMVRNSVDEAIEAVVNENIAALNKIPSSKNKQENSEKKLASPKKDNKKRTPKESKSLENNSQGQESCSSEKKMPRSRSNSASPKKVKKNLDADLNDNDEITKTSPNRKLSFDEDVKKLIFEKSRLPFPSDFQYKYTLSGTKTSPLCLDDLINKVNNAVKEKDDKLTEMLGTAEDSYYYSDEKSLSPNDSVNISTDSDKTIIEFGDQTDNIDEVTDFNSKESTGKTRKSATKGNGLEDDSNSLLENEKNDDPKYMNELKEEQINTRKESDSDEDSCENESDEAKVIDEGLTGKSDLNEKVTDSDIPSENADAYKENGTKKNDSNVKSHEDQGDQNCVKTVSVFEMFGLTLKKPQGKNISKSETDKSAEQSQAKKKCEKVNQEKSGDKLKENEVGEDDDDVLFVSETKPETDVVILSDDDDDDDEIEINCVDRTGFESLKESANAKVRPKFTTVNNVVEPKPLDVLHKLEKAEAKKESAFACNELDEYLNKENILPVNIPQSQHNQTIRKDTDPHIKEELKKAEPDFDEVDGHVFVSFASESALKAHISLEKKMDWLTDSQLKKIAHLKLLKERQQDVGSRRVTDVKSGDEHKQNFRGMPMRLMKYQKQLKQELEDILLGRQSRTPEKSPFKTPTKTTDITKIKGWKKRFQNAEELQEATGLNISESGKVHWKTEERLVKNLDPEEIKDIGLDLKKKRRKLVNYSSRKKSGHSNKPEERDSEMMDYEYEIDELAIIESDVYNEDDGKPPPEKIPYNVKYSSQHKYGMRKLFVKRMKLDAEDERILQKLGTQKHIGQKPEVSNSQSKKNKKGKQLFALSKLTHTMAVAAVSAFDKTLLNRAVGMEKAEKTRNRKTEARIARREGRMSKEVVHNHDQCVQEEPEIDENYQTDDEAPVYEGVDEDNALEEEIDEEPEDEEDVDESRNNRSRRHSSASRGSYDLGKYSCKEETDFPDEEKVEIKTESPDTCTEPGCRYGCICHLCKLSDSGEEKEPDFKPPCDKEYCRLGCICDSIDTKTADSHHCRKPGCMFECKCPPKQPKPDIPRDRDHKKKKKGKGARKKKRTLDKKESEGSGKEEEPCLADDNEWEPPSKRKRGTGNNRFANLPKRETTYRLAKNLDAVSRKAMEVYASSEMFTEQKVRRRRSDQGYEDSSFMSLEMKDPMDKTKSSSRPVEKSQPRLNEATGVLEISDEESDSSEVYPEELSCARSLPYSGRFKQKQDLSKLNKRKGGPTSCQKPAKTVIDLVESDKEDNSGDTKDKRDLPSTSGESRPLTVTEKMGLTNKIKEERTPESSSKWKTQMVCLKAKKKSDEKSQDPAAEIKLLEIMSNCNWEIDRTNMLSKISHIISKESVGANSKSQFITWGAYSLEFLPKAEKPAVIPPELKSKLPSEMFSIRIKVTKKDQKSDKPAEETARVEGTDGKVQVMTEEEKKRFNLKLQKKLIEKIKFAERLRNLILTEEQKGNATTQFSVSREGIEKALKKYKTQLWKAYTGSNNFTIQQLKQALQAAKSSLKEPVVSSADGGSVPHILETSSGSLSTATMSRIRLNQGVTVVTTAAPSSGKNSFINLGNLQTPASTSANSVQTLGNIVIHTSVTSSGPSSNQGAVGQWKLIENIDNMKNVEVAQKTPVSQGSKSKGNTIHKIPKIQTSLQKGNTQKPVVTSASHGSRVSSDVLFMPLDKSIDPSQLPPGAKIAVVQHAPSQNGSPVSFTLGQQGVVLPSSTQIPGVPLITPLFNPMVPSFITNRPVQSQVIKGANASVVSCLSGPRLALQHVPGSAVQTSGSSAFVNGSCASMKLAIPCSPCGSAETVPNSTSVTLPLKNVSNLRSEMTATDGTIMSPSIYPIRFANSPAVTPQTSVTSSEMIGFPKVAGLPMKVVQSQTILVPVTLSLAQSTTSSTAVTGSSVNLQVVNAASSGSPMLKQNPNNPLLLAVPVPDSGSTVSNLPNLKPATNSSNLIPVLNSSNLNPALNSPGLIPKSNSPNLSSNINSVIEKEVDKGQKQSIVGEENEKSDISQCSTAHEKKLKPVTDKTKGLNVQNSDKCDNIPVDSDDNCDKDSLASSTRSLSSLSDMIKTDISSAELVAHQGADKTDEELSKKESRSVKERKCDEIRSILDLAETARIEIANALGDMDELYKEEHGPGDGTTVKIMNKNENEMTNESKHDSDCVVLEHMDDDCVISDMREFDKDNDKGNKVGENCVNDEAEGSVNLKRKRSADLMDSIDCEHAIRKIDKYFKYQQEEEHSHGQSTKVGGETIRIEDSEDSDVDVTSYETLDSMVYVYPPAGSSQQAQVSAKRKFQHGKSVDHDDFQIKKFKFETSNDDSSMAEGVKIHNFNKSRREKHRRLELRRLFDEIEKNVFKYNTTMKSYRGKVPKHMILQEALSLVAALKRREEELTECLDDGRMYMETLKAQLQHQINYFVNSGIPEPIIKNFLKSVEKSFTVPKPKKRAVSEQALKEQSDSEDSDSALEYDALTPAKVHENWTKLVDSHLCSLDTVAVSTNSRSRPDAVPVPLELGTSPVLMLVNPISSNSLEKEATAVNEVHVEILQGGYSQEKKMIESTVKPGKKMGFPVGDEQGGNGADSPSNNILSCQKSSSDDEEVRSSSGDTLIDLENDFMSNDVSMENESTYEPFHKDTA